MIHFVLTASLTRGGGSGACAGGWILDEIRLSTKPGWDGKFWVWEIGFSMCFCAWASYKVGLCSGIKETGKLDWIGGLVSNGPVLTGSINIWFGPVLKLVSKRSGPVRNSGTAVESKPDHLHLFKKKKLFLP